MRDEPWCCAFIGILVMLEEGAGEKEEGTGGAVDENPPTEKLSSLQEQIIDQVEFYFGDRNFPRDKFLQQATASNADGWVPLTTLLTFNRIKALSSDKDYVLSALQRATDDIIQVSEDGGSVRRRPDRPTPDIFAPDVRKEIMERSVYTKGFPEDAQLSQVQEFMRQFGKTSYIQMRRDPVQKKFKGSVFIEFEKKEDAEKYVQLESVEYHGTDLLREWKNDYFKRKQEEKKQKVKDTKAAHDKGDSKEAKPTNSPTSVVKEKGCVLQFVGIGAGKSREDIRDELQEFGTVAYVDFEQGLSKGYVRFREEDGAKRAREGLLARTEGEESPQLCGADTELWVLEGKEEEEYWHKVVDSMPARGKKGGRGGKRGRGRGRGWMKGGQFRKRKRGGEGDNDGEGREDPPEAKAVKIDSED